MTAGQRRPVELRFLLAFAMAAAAALAAALTLRLWPIPAEDWQKPERRSVIETLPSDEVADWKLAYAMSHPAFDIGVFGNSRTFGLGGQHLATTGTFFNFSVGGMSIRQGIAMLEALAAAGKVPRLAVLSMDYVELGLPGILPVSPALPTRLRNNIDDVVVLIADRQYRAAAIQLIEITFAEARRYVLALNPLYIAAKLKVLGLLPTESSMPRTQIDGSRIQYPPSRPMPTFEAHKRSDRYPLLEQDLIRLKRLQNQGTRIILFETAMFPPHMELQEQTLSANAIDVRTRLVRGCTSLAIHCLPPPRLRDDPQQWEDDNHPLPVALAPWFQDAILSGY